MPRITTVMPASNIMPLPQNLDKKNYPNDRDKIKTCMKDKPFQLAKPLIVSMSVFGLLFLNCKKSKWSPVTRAYSIFVLTLLWANVLLLFFAYKDEKFGVASFFKIITHLWFLHCCINATVTYKACNSENRFVAFLLKWSQLVKTNRGSSPDDPGLCPLKYGHFMRRRLMLYLVLAWAGVAVNSVFNAYLLFKTPMADFSLAPLLPNDPFVIPMKAIFTVLHVYRSAAWIFSAFLFLLMSAVIYKEFEIFHGDLRRAISPDGDIADLEWFRRRHQNICQMVETADDVLSAFNAAGIIFPTCDGMLLLYSLVWTEAVKSEPIVLMSHYFWIFGVVAYLLLIGYGGGYLNHMAHAPMKTIHNIRIKDTSPEFSLQMNMFLNKLSGEPIGLTALDMFVIDKPTILTIAGAFITYFIVLIQFQQPTGSVDTTMSVCNRTQYPVNITLL